MFLFGWLVGWMNAILEQITFTTQRVDAPEVKGYPKFVTSWQPRLDTVKDKK
jgi:hypothetical protein